MRIVREYKSYSEYLEHQKEKTLDPIRREKWLGEEWEEKVTVFKDAFKNVFYLDLSELKCLCVCARTGQEVQALKDLGADAIGVDLVPCPPLVIEGDMHNLPFQDNTFNIAFSNSFDHSLSPDAFLSEMRRVTKDKGLILLHLQVGKNLKNTQGYDICEVGNVREVVEEFDGARVLSDRKISYFSSNRELLFQVRK